MSDFSLFPRSDAPYEFSYDQCYALFPIMTKQGPRAAFMAYWLAEEGQFTTEAVEDFSISFYTAYNRFFPGTF